MPLRALPARTGLRARSPSCRIPFKSPTHPPTTRAAKGDASESCWGSWRRNERARKECTQRRLPISAGGAGRGVPTSQSGGGEGGCPTRSTRRSKVVLSRGAQHPTPPRGPLPWLVINVGGRSQQVIGGGGMSKQVKQEVQRGPTEGSSTPHPSDVTNRAAFDVAPSVALVVSAGGVGWGGGGPN